MDEIEALRGELASELAHWRIAVRGLAELENFAAPEAWRALEAYLGLAVRRHLDEAAGGVVIELDALDADLRAARTLPDIGRTRTRLRRFRRRYLQVETILEFYGHAIRSRTTLRLAELLRACDVLAGMSMEAPLRPLGLRPPPVLVYLDRGLGASILRAGLRLWEGGSLSPAAAIKITRFNLLRPTSLIHETGHQVGHLTGWNTELAQALRAGIPDQPVAEVWSAWATELGPDMIAFAQTGYGSVAALHDVVSGETAQVFAYPVGDPHPVAYLRVLVGLQMCERFYGAGPWDRLRRAWLRTHPLEQAPTEIADLVRRSIEQLPRIVEIGLRGPMRAFGGRSLAEVIDPTRVGPAALDALEREAGPALRTSTHYLRGEGLRLLALSSLDVARHPARAAEVAHDFETWMRRLGELVAPAPIPRTARQAA